MDNLIDLHLHTNISDGSMTPAELVRYAKDKGLKAISITDHDSVDGLKEAIAEGKRIGIEVMSGIEINADYEGLELHILGLGIDYTNPAILNLTKRLREERDNRNNKVIQKLNELGFDISLDEVKKVAFGDLIAKQHFIKVMVQKGYADSAKQAREQYIGEGGAAYFSKASISSSQAIEIIKKSNGVAILAHPCSYKRNNEELEKMILKLKSQGLEGIEAYYTFHSDELTKYLLQIARRNQLLVSGGSDFHGSLKPDIDIGVGFGNLTVKYEVFKKIKEFNRNKQLIEDMLF